MVKFDITGKATVGYILMTAIIILAGWLVYGNTQSVMLVDKAEKQFMMRRDLTDRLVYSVLEVNNKERAICLGLYDKLPEFNNAVEQTLATAETLKKCLGNDSATVRIDSLEYLVQMKRQNTFILMRIMGNADADRFYMDKVKSLSQGHDSVMMKQKALEIKEDKETVYEVVKTKKTFFGRLGDAFRKQRYDTVHVARHSRKNVSDSLSHNVDIADTVADVLKQIRQQQAMYERRASSNIKRREQRQQIMGIELTQRISQIMADIRADEHNALQESLDKDREARQDVLLKIILLAIAAAATAIVLSSYIRRSIRREREYRRNIEEAKDETERIMRQREQLLLTITHDIKAPAASISGFIELMKGGHLDRQMQLYIDNIGTSARHLLNLVGALLDYHRLDAGKVEPHPVPFCPNRLVADCVEAMKPQAAEKGLEIRVRADDEKLDRMYKGDTFRIKQIIDNLTGNAIKYTAEGSITVTVDMEARTVDGWQWIKICVNDTGRGMTREESERVFKAFTRLSDAQGTEGVGLGLAITKELVEILGGKIKLVSEKGKGSCFIVFLPLESGEEYNEDKKSDDKGQGQTQKSFATTIGNKNILIVDDDRLQLNLLTEMLGRIDKQKLFTVKAMTHASEALKEIDSFRPDIMFVDIEMPEMSGTEFLKRIAKGRRQRIFAMTAHEPTIKQELLACGFDGCLFKPFSINELAKALSVEIKEEIKGKSTDKFGQLTAFAEGDKDAEREIFSGYISELEEFIGLLGNAKADDLRRKVAHVAHKSLPLMKMIDSRICERLVALSPKYVEKLSDKELSEDVLIMKNEFSKVVAEMKERI
ncbi:hybrid sensor histidine kinase/response regulator [uncultured Prevotella sp.]|uniref:ATP-binding response regulator n=1 Tax=uncultured Prevotella sp. TaxID=159272 RepID=UPI0028040260|nr:hybrid sensor histidine kinase/response regulator [uncultured Prevotella sp.]